MEVATVAKYIEESGEVEVCSTGSREVPPYKIKASACATTELDVDRIVEAATQTRGAVDEILGAAAGAASKLLENKIEFDEKLLEALSLKTAEKYSNVNVTVKVERPAQA